MLQRLTREAATRVTWPAGPGNSSYPPMPVMAVILARVRPNDCSDVNHWRRDLLNAFDPGEFDPDGPLRLLGYGQGRKPPVDDDSLWLAVGIECPTYGEGYERGDPEL